MRLSTVRIHLAAVAAVAVSYAASNAMAGTIANWTFETSIPASAGPFAAEVGTGSALGGTGGTYSSPAGNGVGSVHSFSSNGWDVGDFWQFSFPTTGETGLTFSFDQAGSNTGPANFKVQTSTDGSTYTDLPSGAYAVTLSNWNTTVEQPGFTHTFSLPASLEGLTTAFVRLVDTNTTSINNSTVASGGTDRVDNVVASGIDVPEPCSLLLVLCGLTGFGLARRR